MSPRFFYGLTIAAAICLAVAGTAYYSSKTWAPDTSAGETLFEDLANSADRVAAVAVQHGAESITIERNGETWGIKERDGFPADAEEVRETIVGLTQMATIEEKTRNEDRYRLLHLEDPAEEGAQSRLVRLLDGDGKELAALVLGKIKFGVLGPGRNGTYVRKPGDPQTWLVTGSIAAPSDVRGWAQKTIFEIDQKEVAEIRIVHPDGENLRIVRGEGEGDVAAFGLVDLPEGAKIKADADLAFLATAIAQLELWDVKKAAEIDPAADPVTTTVIAKNGLQVTVTIVSSEGEDHWVTVSAQGPESASEEVEKINSRAKDRAFKVLTFKLANFRKKLADLADLPEPKPEPEQPAEAAETPAPDTETQPEPEQKPDEKTDDDS